MKARRLPRAFYARPTLEVLAEIIGKVLVHDTPGGRASGVIVEAEAYIGEGDPACHAAPGPTRRNAPLYGRPGHAYVYLNYGLHALMNAVTEAAGSPAAILIRALEPREGIDLMRERRQKGSRLGARGSPLAKERSRVSIEDDRLCRGPGNLTVAMGIGLGDNMLDLTRSHLRIEDRGIVPPALSYSPRIGIRVGTDKKWRCCWKGHQGVSGT